MINSLKKLSLPLFVGLSLSGCALTDTGETEARRVVIATFEPILYSKKDTPWTKCQIQQYNAKLDVFYGRKPQPITECSKNATRN